ncbi:MAG: mycofactocin biosynthesis glycosyltransferase MftF [Acidimicrobiales bacterium]|nr:mycofactocin biosynthesis glycosyltransferase MftF [Acidimicrobiales bacterium]
MTDRLPPGGVHLTADVGLRRIGDGRILIGGSPLRIIRLSAAGAAVVDAWLDGAVLADVKSARGLAGRLLDAGMLHPHFDPAMAPAVTIIVPVHDDVARLDELLGTIDLPVVVVDDASTDRDGVAAVVKAYGATLVRRDENGGPGQARMSGLAAVETELVCFVDSDVVLPESWWPALGAHFADERVVAAAPRVRSVDGPTLRERYERVQSSLDLGDHPANVGPRRQVAYVPSAVLAIRAAALVAVDGFDPALRVGEDVDLVWRLVEAGGTVRYAPEIEVEHHPRSTWLGMARQRIHYGSSAVSLSERHGAVVAPARCSRWSAAAWGAIALGRPAAGIAIGAASGVALARKFERLSDAPREAARIAGWGNLHAGLGLARATSRVWWPIAVPLAALSRRLRRALAVALVAPAAYEWWRGRRPADLPRSVALRLADDMAYGVGVWAAVLRARDARALRPELVEWPGRRPAVQDDTVPAS